MPKEKSYPERVEEFIRIISDPDFGKDAKIEVKDEYYRARLITADIGGNILGLRRLEIFLGTTN